tara:strand:+ start:298 stop:903 length:606 start_codon:yes stop_codon:yes gene_type:complete
LKSRLKPTHLAIGVAAIVVAVPLVALSILDLSPERGPVVRIRLADPKPYVSPSTQVLTAPEIADEDETPEPVEMVYPVGTTRGPSRPEGRDRERSSAERSPSGRSTGSGSVSSGSPVGQADLPRPDPERTAISITPRPAGPVRVPVPVEQEATRAVRPANPSVVARATQSSSESATPEQEEKDSVSDIEAAREALRDIRPR